MNDKEFIEKYCHNCSTQRCEGIGTEWFEGCRHKHEHDSFKVLEGIAKVEADAPDIEEAQEVTDNE